MPPAVFEQVGGKWHSDLIRLTLANPANKAQIRFFFVINILRSFTKIKVKYEEKVERQLFQKHCPFFEAEYHYSQLGYCGQVRI